MTRLVRAAVALWIVFASGCASMGSKAQGPAPSPGYSPGEVVQILVEALRENDADDSGIAVVFRFASPENRSVTGPFPGLRR